jgi:hypothetical protein
MEDASEPVLLAAVFDGIWYSAAVQFVSPDNQLRAEYDHPGRLWPAGSLEADAGAPRRVVLYGDNSSARFVHDLVPFETRQHCGCVAILAASGADGQAFPYSENPSEKRDWPGVPRAVEDGYLLVPVIGPDADASVVRAQVVHCADGPCHVEAQTADGRVVEIDPATGPRSCYVGTRSAAEAALAGRTSTPMLWIRHGAARTVDVPLTY